MKNSSSSNFDLSSSSISSSSVSSSSGEFSSSAKQDSTTAISQLKNYRTWNIYRNENSVSLIAGSENVTARLFDLNGKLLLQKNVSAHEMLEIPTRQSMSLLIVQSKNQREVLKIKGSVK